MNIAFYMDVHVPGPITVGLRKRGVDIITAQEDHTDRLSDPKLLDRATQLGRVVFTQDVDFLVEAARRQEMNIHFAGIVFARQRKVTCAKCLTDLEMIAKAGEAGQMVGRVEYLPL